jgi:glycine/D-amino acid oxidase-like deaminating enzyme
MRTDVAIIGGGIMGSALAYWLTRLDPAVSVTVIERDPTYASASSALSAGSIRQQFTTLVNIRISQQSLEFLRRAGELLAVDGDRPQIGLNEGGYLCLADATGARALRDAHAIQRRLGSDIVWLDRARLAARFPWLEVSDLAGGTFGLSGEGWFDGYALLTAFARKARSQGANYRRGEVTGIDVADRRVTRLVLADGARIGCGWAVNAAGPWARAVARLAAIELPVHARRRNVYVIACRAPLDGFPLLVDPCGVWIRPEGSRFIAGLAPRADPDDAPLEPDYDAFEADLWPALMHRVPGFEAARLERAWAGYYEVNVFDYNAILGPHPSVANLLFMNGFSGHGLQQAPIVGLAMAELILRGRFTSLDLSELSFDRVLENRPLRELNVIG